MSWDSEAEVYSDEVPSDLSALNRRQQVLTDINAERNRQIAKWGPQSHPDGTHDNKYQRELRDMARALCDKRSSEGRETWADILAEEFFEALCETDPVALAAELDQVAAVCVAWREDLLKRG